MTTDVRSPATCGGPSRSDCRISTFLAIPMRLANLCASDLHSIGAASDPRQTDRPLSNQQNVNQPRTETVPSVPKVPRVPTVPMVGFGRCSEFSGNDVRTAGSALENSTFGTSGTLGTIG